MGTGPHGPMTIPRLLPLLCRMPATLWEFRPWAVRTVLHLQFQKEQHASGLLNEEIKALGEEQFFHKDYEATLVDTYGLDYEDSLVVEGGKTK